MEGSYAYLQTTRQVHSVNTTVGAVIELMCTADSYQPAIYMQVELYWWVLMERTAACWYLT